MQADWEFEVGGDPSASATTASAVPVIQAHWPGFVDLQRHPQRASQLPEAAELPTLAQALTQLNASASPVWTSKCDVWPITDPAQFDPDELDAPPGSGTCAVACYIDLLPKIPRRWAPPPAAAAVCKSVCTLLGAVPLRCCRVDLVIRRAFIDADEPDLGITAYLTACGPSFAAATQTLQTLLLAFGRAFSAHSTVE
jgi:hypothetical protein